ncbi:MAG: hypothetical protein WAS33_28200 [Candidatus Promineifilaceae bacterium]|nr:hypothetical protein [Anaerolineaceae bacterium]
MNSKWLPVWLVFWLSLPLLVSCTVETAHAPEDELAATATAAPTATYEPDTAVIFQRSGGIGGSEEKWVIFTDGRVETNSSLAPGLSANEVSQLLHSLDSVGFFSLNGSYLPEDTCCDRYLYEITALQGTTFHTVTTLEATPDMPEALQQSLNFIQNALFAGSAE